MRTVGRAIFVLVFENPPDVRCPPSTLPNSLFVEDPLIGIKIRSFQCGQPVPPGLDIFSLAPVVLYEPEAGADPFTGEFTKSLGFRRQVGRQV